ncbi:valine--tRNA ligase [Brevundimonas sp. 2R-24]|uniref:Valine--tRNA ligase n=1 Tax=Peiella sedimenti TaxID=3061083 RepID=A0ABT8SME4_9CAUL|nr:valine--tRNA ligase [Caulobacteraceae bacterium XZ-24]
MLEKTFDPKSVEPRLYDAWETSGAFSPDAAPADAPAYSIVIPPPNVTGSLHIGHALNNTLQDILARYHRMKGEAVLWLPGTDHAGIATQMVVERKLAAEGNISRRDMGREAFVDTVWKWKAESGGQIVRQLRRLGASCDWSRERFTLDEGLSAAVRKVFVQLYREGLIYRDKRLVNWDPHFQTAISDLEVEQKEVDGAYWHFAYPLADGVTYEHPIAFDEDGKATGWETRNYIVVATTRPETMLGDTGVAVHPDDERYAGLVGKAVILPITGRRIPIVADEYADPEKGSGAVKITPAHDFNDFGVGKRAGLAAINVMDAFGRITAADAPEVPADYEGMDRFAARKAIVARAEEEGWLKEVEKTRHMVPHGDRSGVVIEPWLTDQWYVDAKVLAQPALKAVEDGSTVFEPKSYEKIYFEWLRNIEPWCISRQLWWGHRIPAWYGPNGEIFVAETEAEARAQAGDLPLIQDEDVLDTWFSSALWPFSTMGWPEETADLKRFYPTSDLVTGFDIIFFWVARMMMMGVHFMGEVPFRRVVINGLVRDEKGQKMSKSKGNVIDPLEVVDELGADPLRFTMAILSGTRDIKLSKQRIEGYRNFGTKLWNAARFCQMNECRLDPAFDPAGAKLALNRWIRGETVRAAREVSAALDAGRFDEAANALYRFIWNVFCDWHLELAKPVFQGADEAAKAETRAMTAWVLDQTLKLLHPVMPFLTEELWAQTAAFSGVTRETLLISAPWPQLPDSYLDAEADADMGLVIAAVSEGRSVRSELGVPLSAKPDLYVTETSDRAREVLAANAAVISQMLRVGAVRFEAAPQGSAPIVLTGAALALPVAEFIDVAAESARLMKELAALQDTVEKTRKKLDNADFIARAKPEVVEETRGRLAEAEAAHAKLSAAVQRLEGLA